MNPQTTQAKDGTALDSSVVNLAKAIRTVESGNNYDAKGASGEHGAYQWMPGNYEAGAKKYGIDPNDKNPINQDKVAYATLKEWKDKGLTPAQIAAKWNSGSSTGWETKVGTNKQGVKYDVPAYVDNVINAFRAVKTGQEPIGAAKPQPGGPDEPTEATEGYRPLFASSEGDSGVVAGLKAVGNLVPSAFNFAKGVVSSLNPINTLENLGKIPGAFQEAVTANRGSVAATLGNAATSLPGEAVGAFGLRPTMQAASGVAGYLTGDTIGKAEDLAPAAKAFTEDPFGSAAAPVLAAQLAARGVDAATGGLARARTSAYVRNIGENVAKGEPIPSGTGTNLSGAFDSGVSKLAGAVEAPFKYAFGRTPEMTGVRAVADAATREAKAAETAGQIVQGDLREAGTAASVLPRIDTKGVKTYEDLSGRIEAQIKADLKSVDAEYAASKTRTKLADLKETVESDVGGTKASASINYVEEALRGLQELYYKTKDPAAEARIKALTAQARRQGLTAGQINEIAREWGTEFGGKAFSPRTGEPLTSVNAQAFENIRSGVKATSRGFLKTDAAKALDKGVGEMIRVKKLVDDMAEKVNKLEQRVTKRNIMERVGRLLGTAVDMATFGGLRAFVARIFPSNVGLKTMNSLDMQAKLQSNLKALDQLAGMDDATLSSTLAGMIRSAGSALNALPESSVGTKTPYVFGGRANEVAQ